jgi:hypothetical protein
LSSDDSFSRWIAALEAKHFAELTFPEVSRALRACPPPMSSGAGSWRKGAALSGAGKRAAFALFYGPLHHPAGAAHRREPAGAARHVAQRWSIWAAAPARRARHGRTPARTRHG